ncbi:hypothetical protein [Teichococcus vastitatis]|uniref:KTSC domain-containing protein n=1 Tax=Teichococcus vastitatis TaxID=2307076 RepID=A0ABS9WBK6_9PROT|nr:hypothetical protein [Pseudoroseomonas vastitatis]MCI0756674.1 hypothetical protein [Pseudoroseomonas vastitatis]
MSRPKIPATLTHINSHTHVCEEIVAIDQLYAVLCDGKPFQLRRHPFYKPGQPLYTYRSSAFTTQAHAIGFAERLNKKYKTTRFTVAPVAIQP